MNLRSPRFRSFFHACFLALFTVPLLAVDPLPVIGFDFRTATGKKMTATDLAGAGTARVANWNGFVVGNGTNTSTLSSPPVDSAGAVVGGLAVTLVMNAAGSTHDRNATLAAPNDPQLFNSVVDKNDGTASTLTVTGIPYSTYDVYFYVYGDESATNANDRGGRFTIGSTTYYLRGGTATRVNASDGSGYLQSTDTNSVTGLTTQLGNYVRFTGLSGNLSASFTALNMGSSVQRLKVGGFQIVATTAPAPVTTAPAAPTGILALAATGQVSVSWNAANSSTSYNVKRSTSAAGPFVTVGSVTAANGSYVDNTVSNGTTYFYVVSAVNGIGESSNSAVASATPIDPRTIAVLSVNLRAYNTYGMPITDQAGVLRVSYWNNLVGPALPGEVVSLPKLTNHLGATVGGLTVSYTAGNTGTSSFNGSGTVKFGTDAVTVPPALNDLNLMSSAYDQYDGAPSALSVTGIPYSSYDAIFYFRDDGAARGGVVTVGGTHLALRGGVGNPDANGNGFVRSTDAVNTSGSAVQQGNYVRFSGLTGNLNATLAAANMGDSVQRLKFAGFQIVSNDPVVAPTSVPTAPTALTASAGNTQVALNWAETATATSYKVYKAGTLLATVTAPIASYADTAVTNGTSYSYTVSAVNIVGEGPQSSSVSATPAAPPFTLSGQSVYQYSIPAAPIYSARAYDPQRRIYLWVPPGATKLQGVLVGLHNMLEKPMFDDPVIRQACTDANLGIVFISPGDAKTWTPNGVGNYNIGVVSTALNLDPNEYTAPEINPATGTPFANASEQAGAELAEYLRLLSIESGYAELRYAPVMLVGHSAASTFIWTRTVQSSAALTGRVFAILPYKGTWAGSAPAGIPIFHVSSEWQEISSWGNTWEVGDANSARSLRGGGADRLVGEFVQPGTGHYQYSQAMSSPLGAFIKGVAAARIPANWTPTAAPTLNPIVAATGYLVDVTQTGTGNAGPVAYAAWVGAGKDPLRAFWYPDLATAQAVCDVQNGGFSKRPQMINAFQNATTLAPIGSQTNGEAMVRLTATLLGDNVSFQVRGASVNKSPIPTLFHGNALGIPSGSILFKANGSGSMRQTGPDTFLVWMERGSVIKGGQPWEPFIIARHPGDVNFREADRPIFVSTSVPVNNITGAAQTITFPTIPNQTGGNLANIALNATASSGLPVQYWVASGPYRTDDTDNTLLVPDQFPAKPTYPIRVLVGAWQWGKPGTTAAAPIVFQEFFIQAPSPVITSATSANAVADSTFNFQITASQPPTSYGATGLPATLSVDPASGLISGSVSIPGVYHATQQATNLAGTGNAPLDLTVAPHPAAPVINSPASASIPVGATFNYQITATNLPTSFSIDPATPLPAGLTLNLTTGLISGVPTAPGIVTVTIRANNGHIGVQTLTLTMSVAPFVHPGVYASLADLNRLRDKVAANAQPWLAGFNKLAADPRSSATYAKKGPFTSVGRLTPAGIPDNRVSFEDDGAAVLQNAIMWYITGNQAHANKAIEIMNAWSDPANPNHLVNFIGADRRLLAGIEGQKWIGGAEIIRHTGAGWSQAGIDNFSAMLRNLVYPVTRQYGGGNWGTSGMATNIAMGVFLDDREMFDEAVAAIKTGGRTEADNSISTYVEANGQNSETDRDQAHSQLGVAHLTVAAETAWQQGVDLYSYLDNRLLTGMEYLAKYNLGFDVPFTPSFQADGFFNPSISDIDRGVLRPVYEMVWNHYENRMGLPAPFSKQAAASLAPEGFNLDHLGFGTIFFSRETRAAGLPLTPQGLMAIADDAQVDLSWNASPGAASYNVKRAISRSGPFTTIAGGIGGNAYSDPTAINNTLYYYAVTAVNGTGETINSGLAPAYPSNTAPLAPSGVTAAMANPTRIDLSWNESLGATSYAIKRSTTNGGPYATVGSVPSTTFRAFTDTGLSPNTTYYYVVTALNAIGEGAASSQVSATTLVALASPWTATDIGYLTRPGQATEAGGTFTVKASGLDLGGALDSGFFVHTPLTGDGMITARIASRSNYSQIHKAGLLVRESLAADARSAFLMINGENVAQLVRRNSPGGFLSLVGSTTTQTVPSWVRLSRSGNTVAGFVSTDGVAWTQVSSTTLVMASAVQIGFGATSRNNDVLDTVIFDNVSVSLAGGVPVITSSAAAEVLRPVPYTYTITAVGATSFGANGLPAGLTVDANTGVISGTPTAAGLFNVTLTATNAAGTTQLNKPLTVTLLPEPWLDQDIGAPTTAGSAAENGGTFTVRGAGVDIVNGTPANERYHLVYRDLIGDGTLTVRLATLSPGGNVVNDKAGIAMVENVSQGTRGAMLFFENSATKQVRTVTRVSSVTFINHVPPPTPSLPVWLRLQRSGTSVTGSFSLDGTTWTTVSTTAFGTLASTLRIGMMVTSRDQAALNTSTFDNVSVVTPPPVITSSTTANATYGTPFSYTITASNAPTSFTATGLPADLTLTPTTGVISGTPAVVGTFNVTLGASHATGSGSTNLTLTIAGRTYASWAAVRGLTPANNAPDADPEGDGVPNQREFLLGLDPLAPDSGGLPAGTIENGEFVFRFVHDKTSAASFTVQQSTDLLTWTPLATLPESSTTTSETLIAKLPLTGSKRFVRLSSGATATVPLGFLNTTLPTGTTTAFGLPLDDTSASLTGIRAGRIESFTATTITHSAGGWSGNLAASAAPWALRLTSGSAAGKLFDVSANTATTLTLGGATLTTLGVAAGDTFELVLAHDTLGTLFGSTTLQGGTSSATADVVQLRSGAAWIAFYYDTNLGFWRRTSGAATNSNDTLIRSGSGLMILRRGPTLTLTSVGRVLGTTFRTPINNASTTATTTGFPMDTTLGALSLQNLLGGWRSGTSTSTADSIGLYNGTAWIAYLFNGTNWQTTTGVNSDGTALPAGGVLLIQRPGSTAGTTDLIRLQPY